MELLLHVVLRLLLHFLLLFEQQLGGLLLLLLLLLQLQALEDSGGVGFRLLVVVGLLEATKGLLVAVADHDVGRTVGLLTDDLNSCLDFALAVVGLLLLFLAVLVLECVLLLLQLLLLLLLLRRRLLWWLRLFLV